MEKLHQFIAVALIVFLQLGIGQLSAHAQSTTGIYSVTVNTPGTFGQVMLQTVDNWSDVIELTISGHLNSYDMAYFSRMQNITKLDVSNTDITCIMGCDDLSALETMVLPSSVKTIEDDAFYNCTSLTTFSLDNIESIGTQAFGNCTGLTGTITGPNVKTIGDKAFYCCNNINAISFPVIEKIGDYAFATEDYYNSKLSSAEISNVKYVGGSAFQYCSSLKSINLWNCVELGTGDHSWRDGCFYGCNQLTNVVLSNQLTEIPDNCFSYTGIQQIDLPSGLTSIGSQAFYHSKLSSIIIPEGVKTIYYYAFRDCPLESITLPSSLESIDNDAFYYHDEKYNSSTGQYDRSYVLKDVYCKTVVPIATSVFNGDMAKSATLHVPAFSVSAYKLDDNWYKFNKIEAIDGDLTDVTINNTFTIIDYSGLANNANFTLTSSDSQGSAGHLTISGEGALSLNNYVQYQNLKYELNGYYDENVYNYEYPYCTTLITNNEVRANNVTTKIKFPTNQWSFISMPYDVNVSSIVAPEGTMWVIRRYNGANRAAMSGETWENVTSGQTLNAGEGYIFHCVNDNSDSWSTEYVEFEFPAINNANKNNIFTHNDVATTIKEYPAEFSHNRGWNLIGNPYPSFFSSQYIDFPAPITVWNGNGYTAVSLADDKYVLHPNEAFFVQCPLNTNQFKFSKDGRTHGLTGSGSNANPSGSRAQSLNGRAILNFMLAGENYSDRTRLVLNEAASYDYEIDKDASKFMSNNESVPQIYIIDNGVNYAIDERPLGTGEYSLGIKIGKKGNYKISLNTNSYDYDVMLTDKIANVTTVLSENDYAFEASAQTVNNRFLVTIVEKGGQTSIDNVATDTIGFTVSGNLLTVDNEVSVSVYAIDGKLIYNGIVNGSVELPAGIYLLSIDNTTHKIAIK